VEQRIGAAKSTAPAAPPANGAPVKGRVVPRAAWGGVKAAGK
jgi:hypothetical protein